jgi:hypothetical protein
MSFIASPKAGNTGFHRNVSSPYTASHTTRKYSINTAMRTWNLTHCISNWTEEVRKECREISTRLHGVTITGSSSSHVTPGAVVRLVLAVLACVRGTNCLQAVIEISCNMAAADIGNMLKARRISEGTVHLAFRVVHSIDGATRGAAKR